MLVTYLLLLQFFHGVFSLQDIKDAIEKMKAIETPKVGLSTVYFSFVEPIKKTDPFLCFFTYACDPGKSFFLVIQAAMFIL